MRLMLVVVLALLAMAPAPGRLLAQAAAIQPITPRQETLAAAAQLRLPAGQPFASELALGVRMTELALGVRMTERARGNQRQAEILQRF